MKRKLDEIYGEVLDINVGGTKFTMSRDLILSIQYQISKVNARRKIDFQLLGHN